MSRHYLILAFDGTARARLALERLAPRVASASCEGILLAVPGLSREDERRGLASAKAVAGTVVPLESRLVSPANPALGLRALREEYPDARLAAWVSPGPLDNWNRLAVQEASRAPAASLIVFVAAGGARGAMEAGPAAAEAPEAVTEHRRLVARALLRLWSRFAGLR